MLRRCEAGDERGEGEYLLVLHRVAVKARSGRAAGPPPEPGALETWADGGATRAVLRRLGAHALPTLARHEPDIDHSTRIKEPATAALVREIGQVDLARLPEGERALLRLLSDWGRRAAAARGALRIIIDDVR
ncbi:hypothetical protein [Kitasatospora sp. NPDC058190]|uniref:hypothetical protein n=1 Tax=Kitasatospora sp. NPDC058190 TaxID=3346371 RepID=UPI0036DDF655